MSIAVDIDDKKLALAKEMGAVAAINSTAVADVSEAVMEISKGGVHVSLDALGNPITCFNSIKNLRRRGKHVQVGLMLADHATPQVPNGQDYRSGAGNIGFSRHAGPSL